MIATDGALAEASPLVRAVNDSPTLGNTPVIPDYEVLEPLGRGGMARVYRAYHPQLDRYVAIKVLSPHFATDEEFRARFQREAAAIARLLTDWCNNN